MPTIAVFINNYSATFNTVVIISVAAAKLLQSCPTLHDPIDSSPPGSPVLGFSRQEHWSGLPFPSPIVGALANSKSHARMSQVPSCSGIRRSVSCLFCSMTPAKLCWLFRGVLRYLIPRN